MSTPNSFKTGPDERGLFGIFGGRFVAETLMPLILDLEREWGAAKPDPAFWGISALYTKVPCMLFCIFSVPSHPF